MKVQSLALLLYIMTFQAPATARADEWAVLGPRAMGMGGAGVAVTRGALGVYWNPATLMPPRAPRLDSAWDVEVPASLNIAATNDAARQIADIADILEELDLEEIEDALDAGTNLTDEDFQRILRLLTEELPGLARPGTGLVTNASGGLMVRLGSFGFSALAVSHGGAEARIDLTNLALGDEGIDGVIGAGNDRDGELSGPGQAFADSLAAAGLATQNQAEEIVFQAAQGGVDVSSPGVQENIRAILAATQANDGGSLENFFTRNGTGVDLRGIILQEYALAYAQPILDILTLGVSAKLLYGMTYFKPYSLAELDVIAELADDVIDSRNREESVRFGLDLGALAQPIKGLSVGIIARNLNRPKFDVKGPGDYVVDPQLRAGVALGPFAGLTIAADIDCFVNHSRAFPGYDSQVLGGGVEYSILDVVFLRAGLSKNLVEEDENVMLHAGLGVRLGYVHIEVAASATPEWTEVSSGIGRKDPDVIPERGGLSAMIGVNIPLD
ncbi:MAG TPA: conjugal transfer protein TraF [Planctomycetota bacterium]|nr:conjugal transfer protein TraF [Planctomycetota bacterium]